MRNDFWRFDRPGPPGRLRALSVVAFSIVSILSVVFFYGRAGCLPTLFGGVRSGGQCAAASGRRWRLAARRRRTAAAACPRCRRCAGRGLITPHAALLNVYSSGTSVVVNQAGGGRERPRRPRSRMQARGQLWVFGGYVGAYPGFDPEMYRFDLAASAWHTEPSSGKAYSHGPRSRSPATGRSILYGSSLLKESGLWEMTVQPTARQPAAARAGLVRDGGAGGRRRAHRRVRRKLPRPRGPRVQPHE